MADGLRWDITDDGILDVEEFFDYAGYKSRDMRQPLREVQFIIEDSITEQLDTQGHGGWEPLTQRYGDWKAIRAPGAPMLELTGKMRTVIETPAAWEMTMTTLNYDTMRADPGKAGMMPGWHQEGAMRSKGGFLPPRPILELNESDYEYMEDAFVNWLDELRDNNSRRGAPDVNIRPSVF